METTTAQRHAAGTGGWAYYRLPEEEVYTHVACHKVKAIKGGLQAVGRERGVVVAPFEPTADEPCLLISPDSLQTRPVPEADDEGIEVDVDVTMGHDNYARGFNLCHQALTRGTANEMLKKVVMCRRVNLTFAQKLEAKTLFLRACRRLPHSYVSLWHTPQSGMWLVATPEFLLVADSDVPRRYYTMALAGTLPYEGRLTPPAEWTDKNRAEQRLVSATIFEQLTDLAVKVDQSPVHTVRAARLQHLRTDFAFEVSKNVTIGQLVHLRSACRSGCRRHQTGRRPQPTLLRRFFRPGGHCRSNGAFRHLALHADRRQQRHTLCRRRTHGRQRPRRRMARDLPQNGEYPAHGEMRQ